jgi:hypothetical protein
MVRFSTSRRRGVERQGRARQHWARLGFGTALVLAGLAAPQIAAFAQSLTQSSLDEDGITLQFSPSHAGQQLMVMAQGLGKLGVYTIDAQGVVRIDLSNRQPRRNVCFLAINPKSLAMVKFTPQYGFRNPFWETKGRSPADNDGAGPQTNRSTQEIARESAEFEAKVSEAKAVLAQEAGGRYRNGICNGAASRSTPRPYFSSQNAAGAAIYAAARCEPVFAQRPGSCRAVINAAALDDTSAFELPDCDNRLINAREKAASAGFTPADRADAAAHAAIVARARAELAANPGQRAQIAGQCVADVRQSAQYLWRRWDAQETQQGAKEQAAKQRCEAAVVVVADEDVRRRALAQDLAAARARDASAAARPKTPAAGLGLGRSVTAYPCLAIPGQ